MPAQNCTNKAILQLQETSTTTRGFVILVGYCMCVMHWKKITECLPSLQQSHSHASYRLAGYILVYVLRVAMMYYVLFPLFINNAGLQMVEGNVRVTSQSAVNDKT